MIQSRTMQKLDESKHLLELHTENVESRKRLIEKNKTELANCNSFLESYVHKLETAQRMNADAKDTLIEQETKYRDAKDASTRAETTLRRTESDSTYLDRKQAKIKFEKNVIAYATELRVEETKQRQAADAVREYQKAVAEETRDLMYRAKQDAVNNNSKPGNYRKAA